MNHMILNEHSYAPDESNQFFFENNEPDPCEGCESKDRSDCCGEVIKWTDICTGCLSHCGTICDECEFKPTNK